MQALAAMYSHMHFFIADVADDLLQVDINEDANGDGTREDTLEGMEAAASQVKDLSDLVFTNHTGTGFYKSHAEL